MGPVAGVNSRLSSWYQASTRRSQEGKGGN